MNSDTRSAAAQLEAMVVPLKKKPRKRNGPQLGRVKRDMEKIISVVNDPKLRSKMKASEFVALYAWLHAQVYNVDPSNELEGKSGLGARAAAKFVLKTEFADNVDDMVMFLRWTWWREREREEWRKVNNRHGGRITWRYQFSGGLVNEYRLMRRREINKMPVTRVTDSYASDGRSYSLST